MGLLEDFQNSDLRDDDSKETKQQYFFRIVKEEGYNLDEMQDIIQNDAPYQLVESVAGSGKSTTLILKVLYDMYIGRSFNKKVWVSTFLKSGAETLKHSFYRMARRLGINVPMEKIVFGTIHSEFYQILRAIDLKINIISPKTDRAMKNDISKEYGIGQYPGFLNNNEIQIFDTVETYVNSCTEKPTLDTLNQFNVTDLTENVDLLLKVIELLHDRRLQLEQYSFDDLQRILYDYLYVHKVPYLYNLIKNKYKYIYVDEFQDTSSTQYAIMKVFCEQAEQSVFVGDSDQSIYSWRGARVGIIMHDVVDDFNVDIKNLTKNYRVPSNILQPIARSIKKNTDRRDKAIVSANEGGVVKVKKYKTQSDLDLGVVELLKQAEDVPKIKSVAVLASTNLDITGLSTTVLMDSKQEELPFRIGGTVQKLNRLSYRKYWNLAYIFSNKPNHHLADNLKELTNNKIKKYRGSKIEETFRNQGYTLLKMAKSKVWKQRYYTDMIGSWANYLDGATGVEGILKTYEFLEDYINEKIVNYPDNQEQYMEQLQKISVLKMILQKSEVKTPEEYLQQIQRINDMLEARYRNEDEKNQEEVKTDTNIVFTTPFDFKGKEADMVIIYCDTDNKYPRYNSHNYEEERRLHYIAGTRAKKVCVYTTIQGYESPFLKETGLLDN